MDDNVGHVESTEPIATQALEYPNCSTAPPHVPPMHDTSCLSNTSVPKSHNS